MGEPTGGQFVVEIEDKYIVIRPVTNKGRKLPPLVMSISAAAVLSEALRQTVEIAKIKCYN